MGVLASLVMTNVASYDARASISNAARMVPSLMASYRRTHRTMDGAQDYLQARLAPIGVIALIAPPFERIGQPFQVRYVKGPPPPGAMEIGYGTQRGAFLTKTAGKPMEMPRPPLFFRLFDIQLRPVQAAFAGGTAVLVPDPIRFRSFMLRIWETIAILAIVVLIVAWRVAIVVAGHTLEPLLRTTRALNRFGDGDFTPEAVSTSDRSELGELARAYNRAVDQISRAFDERSQTEAEMRQFVADAGHQLRTPLTVIMGYLSAMAQRPATIRQATVSQIMLAQSRRMKGLIDDLITLARLEHSDARTESLVDVNDLAMRVPDCFDEGLANRVAIHTSSETILVRANETDVLGALCALVDNALKYAPDGNVDVRISREGRQCTIEVADDGPGLSEADLQNAFDRFYRGSSSEGVTGTGLGLAIVRRSVERAGGTIALRNGDAGGLVCTVSLPAEPPLQAAL